MLRSAQGRLRASASELGASGIARSMHGRSSASPEADVPFVLALVDRGVFDYISGVAYLSRPPGQQAWPVSLASKPGQ